MSAALLAAAEPRRTRGGAGGAVRYNRPRRRSEQSVWVPEALFRGSHYNDEAIAVYVKVAALDARRTWLYARPDEPPCTAAVTELAIALGMSVSAIERGLCLLNKPGPCPDDDEPWIATRRRTHRGGTGHTAERYARLVPHDQAAIEVPVRIAEALTPRRFRAWLHLTRATRLGLPVTGAELAGELFHHTGQNAGQPLSAKSGLRLMDDLEAGGWLELDRRAGRQGRHLVTVHHAPLHPVGTSTDIHDGSGPADHDGSLTSKEDRPSPTDGCSREVDPGIRRRRLPVVARGPVDNPSPDTFRPAGGQGTSGACSGGPADGSGPTLSARAWSVLKPVRHLLAPQTSGWVISRIEREIRGQLAQGTGMRRITARLERRYAATKTVRDGGRWILGVGLPRNTGLGRCAMDVCEDGVIWHTGQACQVCLDIALYVPAAAADPDASALEKPRPAPNAVAPTVEDLVPIPPPVPSGPEPPVLTRAQRRALREAATPDSIRAAIDTYGRAAAGRIYGLQRVAQQLNAIDGYTTNGEASAPQ
ncbi:hypothetical protein AB0903_09175 [Streptomyces sp. NPDC048389]|uniref:hypothetical protein n=1 Tax=Streptomyces sp. NPDC048389 TaxID=3154622 RepID=UPI003453E8C6